jgi:hypothetical protein
MRTFYTISTQHKIMRYSFNNTPYTRAALFNTAYANGKYAPSDVNKEGRDFVVCESCIRNGESTITPKGRIEPFMLHDVTIDMVYAADPNEDCYVCSLPSDELTAAEVLFPGLT